jgi:hypothetical protein
MKPCFAGLLKVASVSVTGMFLSTGCVSTIRLKVVDAKTSRPLAEVSAVWREDVYDLILGQFQTGPTNLAPSSDNGTITINRVHKKRIGRLILSHPGYATLYGAYSTRVLELSEGIRPPPLPQDRFILEDPKIAEQQSNGLFVVPMTK